MKIKTIVHYSDLHLKLYKQHTRDKNILEVALKEWKKLSPDRIVFTGDFVHSKNQMTPELINLMSWFMTETAKICKCVYIIGNHDFLENNLERLDTLSPLIFTMNNENIIYLKENGVMEDENIMWVIYSLVNHNHKPAFTPTKEHTYIGLFHGPIQGLVTDMGFAFEDGYNTQEFSGCDLVLAGDIHKRQVVDIPNGKKAYMIGSLIQQNFGEAVRNHGYGIYEVQTDKYIFKDIDNKSPYLNFKITDIADIENENETLTNF